jgi:hypothetical protein
MPRRLPLLCVVAVWLFVFSSNELAAVQQSASEKPAAWEMDAQKRHDALIEKNGSGTDAALQRQLLRMRDEDQAARGFTHGQQTSKMTKAMIAAFPATDKRLTEELKQVVAKSGWPVISLVGIEASNGAMLILTHTADHAWQKRLLPELQRLAAEDKIDGSSLALVVDKELVAEGKQQLYGSQFKFINGKMAMYAVEDPSRLDERRAKALLPPMSVYKQVLEEIYHLQASEDVVMPTKPSTH